MPVQSLFRCAVKQNGRRFLVSLALLLLVGCLGSPPDEQGVVVPLANDVQTLAMLRTTWDGTRPDSFCQPDIGDDLRLQVKQALQARGYRVIDFKAPRLENSNRPDPVAGWSGAELINKAPPAADGIFRLRVTEYLDAALCDGGFELKSLNIAAIAEIFAPGDGRLVWQTRQWCSELSRSTSDVVYRCSVELADKIGRQLAPVSP